MTPISGGLLRWESSQLISEVRAPFPAMPGHPVRDDDAYRQEGSCHVLMCLEPLQGWRHVKVTDRRTAQDLAHCLQDLVALQFPQETVISVGLDHLNPHTPVAWSATFPPAEACRMLRKLDFHDTPKHDSWLKMAAIEFAVVSTRGLDRQ